MVIRAKKIKEGKTNTKKNKKTCKNKGIRKIEKNIKITGIRYCNRKIKKQLADYEKLKKNDGNNNKVI